MKKCILVSIIFAFSSLVQAAKWHKEYISMVYPLSNGNFVLTFKSFPEECSNSSKYFYVEVGKNGMTIEGANKVYSLALTAASTNKQLSINYDETSSLCHINRAYIVF